MAETSNLNQSNIEQQAFISIRLVTMDHYMSDPITSDLDPVYSSFRSSPVKKVPVLRIFGPTPNGQKTCLHLHGILRGSSRRSPLFNKWHIDAALDVL